MSVVNQRAVASGIGKRHVMSPGYSGRGPLSATSQTSHNSRQKSNGWCYTLYHGLSSLPIIPLGMGGSPTFSHRPRKSQSSPNRG